MKRKGKAIRSCKIFYGQVGLVYRNFCRTETLNLDLRTSDPVSPGEICITFFYSDLRLVKDKTFATDFFISKKVGPMNCPGFKLFNSHGINCGGKIFCLF